MHDPVVAAVAKAAHNDGFTLDVDQHRLVAQLADIVGPRRRRRHRSTPRGAYVYGPVGRGKSWIVDAVFDAAAAPKLRVHSHEFFHLLHARIHAERGDAGALRRALHDIIGSHGLLVFDELHIHDPGDARLLIRVLEYVLTQQITLLVTSNYQPDDLLPNPVWHHLMEDGIAMITENLAIARLDGNVDHRIGRRAHSSGFASGGWIVSSAAAADAAAADAYLHLAGRRFPVVSAGGGHLRVTFDHVCDAPLSTVEYIEWSALYGDWTVTGVPMFGAIDREAQQRFINLVDVLADRDVCVTFCSAHALDDFLTSAVASRPDAFRMISRMRLLRTF
ncbi:cell division protein ZapE [Williamsia sp. MIQD14]|uniref:cell division protein ZapE n=1 Tax=Williamsia sp. MIQD14 TaxID=3425703 RepID=UPI003DA1C1F0